MRRAKPLHPASAELFALIRRLSSRKRKVTLGVLWRKLDKSKTTVCETIQRLERDGWVSRGPFEQGKEREIKPLPKRKAVAK